MVLNPTPEINIIFEQFFKIFFQNSKASLVFISGEFSSSLKMQTANDNIKFPFS